MKERVKVLIGEKVWFKEVWNFKNDIYAMWKYHNHIFMEIFKEEFSF